jgi:hypothetical protein
MAANPGRDVVVAELHRAGVRDHMLVNGGKHQQVHWRVNGSEPRHITIPTSPSDRRWEQNLKHEVRKILREDGLLVGSVPAEKLHPKPPDRLSRLEQAVRSLEQRIANLEANGVQADSCTQGSACSV